MRSTTGASTRFGVLFSAGEIEAGSDVAESVVDSSEIINTLKGGGISSLGYADVEVDESNRGGLLSRLRGDSDSGIDSTETTNRVTKSRPEGDTRSTHATL